jgi:hypothetical protein
VIDDLFDRHLCRDDQLSGGWYIVPGRVVAVRHQAVRTRHRISSARHSGVVHHVGTSEDREARIADGIREVKVMNEDTIDLPLEEAVLLRSERVPNSVPCPFCRPFTSMRNEPLSTTSAAA